MPEIRVHGSELRFACRDGQSVLDAMRSVHHRLINAGCRNGGCGVCKIRLVSGQCRDGLMSQAHVSKEEQAAGYRLACRIWPLADVEIEVVGKLPQKICRGVNSGRQQQ